MAINWNHGVGYLETALKGIIKGAKNIELVQREDIREQLPPMTNVYSGVSVRQPRLNLYRNKTKDEIGKTIISGFPLSDDRHQRIKDPHGYVDGSFIGFMDDNTPVRIRQDNYGRMSNKPDRLWCKLESSLVNANLLRLHSGPSDNRCYCALDFNSAAVLLEWYSIAKAINGRYPVWANQFDVWKNPSLQQKKKAFTSLCLAYALADNRCVVTKFEIDNPVIGAPEILVDNPLCPGNQESFWSTTLDGEIVTSPG